MYMYLVKTDKMMLIRLEFTYVLRLHAWLFFSRLPTWFGQEAQCFPTKYIYLDSKLLAPVVYFAKLVKSSLWAVWVEQHAPYTRFLPRPARKESNVPKLRSYCLIYILCFPTSSVRDVFMVHFNNVIFYWCYNDILWVFYSCSNFDTFSSNISLSLQQPELW